MIGFLAVGVGGALGALARAMCTEVLASRLPHTLPFPTLVVNIAACLAMGIAARCAMDSVVRLMFCVGFLGGFSTLAAVCYEAVGFAADRDYVRCFGYLLLTYAVCLASAAAGYALAGYALGA